jgi:hypothetical protein
LPGVSPRVRVGSVDRGAKEGEGVNRGRVISIAGAVAIATAAWASPASAATLLGDYQLQGTHASSGPGPALSDVAPGNSFQTENVMGKMRQVLTFPRHSGLLMTPSVGTGQVAYSFVSTFRLNPITQSPDGDSFVRILDQGNGSTDLGYYSYQGMASYYGAGPEVDSTNVVFSDNTYTTVAITSQPPNLTRIYVNGALVVSAPETLPVVANTLRFFKDNNVYEESPGAVSCVRVYSGVLTDDEVHAIGASPTCGTVAATPPVRKKCKKHKRKRSAESAKKKCKKKKRR